MNHADSVCEGVVGTWEIHSLERDTVLDTSVSEVDSLHTEGRRLGTTLLVDIDYCSHVVGEQLNVARSDGGGGTPDR